MRSRNRAAMSVVAGLATIGAVAAVTLPANAADKGDDQSSRVSAQRTHTGSAIAGNNAARPQPGGASGQRVTGDTCTAYSDGHGDLCLWYSSNFVGSRTGFLRDDANLSDDRFVEAGSGQSSTVTNNAESAWNYDRFGTAFVTTSPNYTGFVGSMAPNSGGNFSATYKNNVESIYWAG